MEFDVLPGPSLPERARTALARAATAFVSDPCAAGAPPVTSQVPVRATRDGSPLLLPRTGSLMAAWLADGPDDVRVSLPAGPPFSALRLTGTVRRVAAAGDSGITACAVAVDEWVVPRGLDEVPVSLRAALTCRCRCHPGHGHGPEAEPGQHGSQR
jgi:hypothetical protein